MKDDQRRLRKRSLLFCWERRRKNMWVGWLLPKKLLLHSGGVWCFFQGSLWEMKFCGRILKNEGRNGLKYGSKRRRGLWQETSVTTVYYLLNSKFSQRECEGMCIYTCIYRGILFTVSLLSQNGQNGGFLDAGVWTSEQLNNFLLFIFLKILRKEIRSGCVYTRMYIRVLFSCSLVQWREVNRWTSWTTFYYLLNQKFSERE